MLLLNRHFRRQLVNILKEITAGFQAIIINSLGYDCATFSLPYTPHHNLITKVT